MPPSTPACPPIRVPVKAASRHEQRSTIRRPEGLPSWSDSNFSRESYRHQHLFVPNRSTADGWLGAMRASQHPFNCSDARFLLVEDDLDGAGLGYTARLLAALLLFAMRDRRVLLEVPQTNASTRSAVKGRWCSRAPHTLQCAYLPWSHCDEHMATELQHVTSGSAERMARLATELQPSLTAAERMARAVVIFEGIRPGGAADPTLCVRRTRQFVARCWPAHARIVRMRLSSFAQQARHINRTRDLCRPLPVHSP
jgi:hypothetical protein